MADTKRSLIRRILDLIGPGDDEVAAGHGSLPEAGPRPSTQSRRRSREHQRERLPDDPEKEAEAIAEALGDLDEQIRRSVDDSEGAGTSSEDMVKRARERWSSD